MPEECSAVLSLLHTHSNGPSCIRVLEMFVSDNNTLQKKSGSRLENKD